MSHSPFNQQAKMLRPQPTSISLTVADINRTTERIAARQRAAGKARIRQGPERSRDEAIRSMGRGPSVLSSMTAMHVAESGQESIVGSQSVPKILFTSASGASRTRHSSRFNISSASSEGQDSDVSDLVVPHQRAREMGLGAPSGRELSQLHLDGQAEDDASATQISDHQQHHIAQTGFLNPPAEMDNRSRPELGRSPLYQSQIMSSPNVSSSPNHRVWSSRQQHDHQQLHGGE